MTIFSLDNKTGMWYSIRTYIEKELQPKPEMQDKDSQTQKEQGAGSQ